MKLQIKSILKEDWSDWNDFVINSGIQYTIAHNPCLGGIIEMQNGWNHKNVVLLRDDKVAAVFPYMRKDDQLISMPYFSYGGILTSIDEIQLSNMLLDMVFHYEDQELVDHKLQNVELRLFRRSLPFIRNNKVSPFVKLAKDAKTHFDTFKPDLKRKLFKANSLGYKTVEGGMDLIPEFFDLYLSFNKGKGSVSLTREFLRNLMLNYDNGDARVFLTYHDDKVVAGGVYMSYLGSSEAVWSAVDPSPEHRYAAYSLHWTMMKKAITEDCQTFSLGLSEFGSLSHVYKKQWGGNDYVLYWNYMFDPGKPINEFSFFGRLVRNLPNSFSRSIEPLLTRMIY